ncbi:MarR family winged helix-turn-helix transcriptional regulator [Microbacterium sp.]|uniref:MarR family winged helix-turn-helix transcriptional regulator n=1 Tax=Microbacterium sp. TaxID=51671 RepID=UPI0039E7150F
MTDATAHDLDAIAAALAALRGRGPGLRGFGPHGLGPHGLGAQVFGAQGFGSNGFDPRDPRDPRNHRNPGDPRGGDEQHRGRPAHDAPGERGGGGAGPGSWFGPGGPGARGGMSGPARLRLLEALAAASHPLSVSEVGEAIGVDQPRASRLIQQAVDLGLVRREADPDDARRTRIALTDAGTQLARGFRGQRREHLAQALASFTDDERAELARLLGKLAAGWPQA